MAVLQKQVTLGHMLLGMLVGLITIVSCLIGVGKEIGEIGRDIMLIKSTTAMNSADIKRIDSEGSIAVKASDKARSEAIAYIQRQIEEVKVSLIESRREQQRYFEELLRQAKQGKEP